MKKKSMKVLSLVLAIVMAISIIPLSALADELTGPKRKVGVVVYGAEVTAVLTQVEEGFKGNVDLEESLTYLTDMLTKLVDGTGISVPEVDVSLTSDTTGKVYKLEETKDVEIFTETTEMYIGFQEEIDKQLTKLEEDLANLRIAMKESNSLTAALAEQLDAFEDALTTMREKFNDLKKTLVGSFNNLAVSPNGILYRTYVTEEAIPADATYTAYVAGFVDTDEDGNAITRDGYILYNDGLGTDGSMLDTERTFPVEVKEQGRFDHEIQFVGPLAGIEGTLNLPEAFDTAYDTFVNVMNTMGKTAEEIKNYTTDSTIVSWVADWMTDLTNTGPIYKWFTEWTAPQLSTSDEISKDYRFGFPGLWCAEADAGFTFKDVDVAEAGITGSEFLMVNRDELLDVLKFMVELGKDAFNGAIKATFGGEVTYADGTAVTYEGITDLYKQLLKTEDGQLSLDYDTAYAIIKTYIGVISDMNLFDRVVVKETNSLGLTELKLKYPIPAILKAESDEDGLVAFNKSSNVTLTWMLDIIPQILDFVDDKIPQDNEVLTLLATLAEYATKMSEEFADLGSKVINTLVYPFAQRLGVVGKKFGAGDYIMFQFKAADGYWINPMAYTMKVEWINESWIYVTLADLGIIMPYFAEGFYDFVRNTTVAGTIDKFLGKLTGKTDFDLISKILSDDLDMTAELNQQVTAALTAFAAKIGYEALGGDTLFSSTADLAADMNQYLYNQGRTAQNLMVYMNNMALKAKAVYAGDLTPVTKNGVTTYWQFYNLDKSPTATLNKVIEKTTENIAACFVSDKQKTVVTNTGAAVQKVVNAVSTAVETTVTKVTTKVTTAAKTAASKVVKSVASTIKSTASSLFSKIFSK